MHTLTQTRSTLLAHGYQWLGAIPSGECTTHYFVNPLTLWLATYSDQGTGSRLSEYPSHRYEILALSRACEQKKSHVVTLPHAIAPTQISPETE